MRNPRHRHLLPSRECISHRAKLGARSPRSVESLCRSSKCPLCQRFRVYENKSVDRNSDQLRVAHSSGESAYNKLRCRPRSKPRCRPLWDIARARWYPVVLCRSRFRKSKACRLRCRLLKARPQRVCHPAREQTNRSRSCLWRPAHSDRARLSPIGDRLPK